MDLFNKKALNKLNEKMRVLMEKNATLTIKMNEMENVISMMDDELLQFAVKKYLGKNISIINEFGSKPKLAFVDSVDANKGIVELYEKENLLIAYPMSHLELLVTII